MSTHSQALRAQARSYFQLAKKARNAKNEALQAHYKRCADRCVSLARNAELEAKKERV